MSKNKVALFYNPVSGKGFFKKNLDEIIDNLQKVNLQVFPWRLGCDEDLAEIMLRMELENYHTVIAAGGDGTVHEVVNAIKKINLKVPLGIFPAGTSNDMARNLQIPEKCQDFCRLIKDGQTDYIDLGLVKGHYFVNSASAGLFTDVAHQVPSAYKNLFGKLAYYFKGIEKIPGFKAIKLEIEADDISFCTDALLFIVLNGNNVAGMNGVLPISPMNDGKMELLVLKEINFALIPSLLAKLRKGEHLEDPRIFFVSANSFKISCQTEIETDMDGEKASSLPWHVKVEKKSLEVRVK